MALPLESVATSDQDPIDVLAEEYTHRCRLGERPSIDEYAARHPELAEEIRRLFPAIALLEGGKRAGAAVDSRPGSKTEEMLSASGVPLRRLGENRIVRELGRGGMGIVYEAEQEPLGRRVAVKVLPRRAHGDPTSRERFFREARVVAKLQHPHIVPIHSLGEQDGLPYYVMPLIDGAGLDRLLAAPAAKLPFDLVERARWAAGLGRQAAEALAYAHGEGILHRDIKPSNLLLDASGTLWLADFGLAKLADDLSLTSTGDLPGTLRYLAPECLGAGADARSDLYSLGLTLYEMLVGRPAFLEMDRVRLLHQIASHHVPAPRQVAPGLPRDIETIVLKAIAPDPAARYATAADLSEDLGRFLDGRPIRARRASPAERLMRWCRRNPVVAALATASIVLGLVAVIFVRFYLIAPPLPPDAGWPPDDGFGPPPEFRDPVRDGFRPPPRPFHPPPKAPPRGRLAPPYPLRKPG